MFNSVMKQLVATTKQNLHVESRLKSDNFIAFVQHGLHDGEDDLSCADTNSNLS